MIKTKTFLMNFTVLMTGFAVAIPLTFTPVPAKAGSGDGLVGFGVGVLVGIGISKGSKRSRDKRKYRNNSKYRKRAVAARSKRSAEMRKIQTSLAQLGFYHKKIDGLGGRGTRRAISDFQSARGFAVTGRLSKEQKSILLSSYGSGGQGNQPYGNGGSYGQTYAGNNPNAEVDVFGNSVPADQASGQFGAPTPSADVPPTSAPQPSPEVDDNELVTIFDLQNTPNKSKKVVNSDN